MWLLLQFYSRKFRAEERTIQHSCSFSNLFPCCVYQKSPLYYTICGGKQNYILSPLISSHQSTYHDDLHTGVFLQSTWQERNLLGLLLTRTLTVASRLGRQLPIIFKFILNYLPYFKSETLESACRPDTLAEWIPKTQGHSCQLHNHTIFFPCFLPSYSCNLH
jgi:hypothetical protein